MDIVCLGELLIDMFPNEVGRSLTEVSAFRPKPGGAPANVAVAAVRLGAESAFIGKVGDDPFGHHLADVLRQEGVEVSGMRYDPQARTPLAFIAMPDVNSYEILFYRNPGADMRLHEAEIEVSMFDGARCFHFGSITFIDEPCASAQRKALALARERGLMISYDPNYRPTLWSDEDTAREVIQASFAGCHLAKISAEEWESLVKPWKSKKPDQVMTPVGCLECRNTGYQGRMGIYEMFTFTGKVRKLVNVSCDISDLRQQTLKDGLIPLRLSGASKVARGSLSSAEDINGCPSTDLLPIAW